MNLNILITSVSRKVWLVKAFKRALELANTEGKVISVDMNHLSAGLYFSDKYYLVPPVSDKKFLPNLINICKTENIHLLIPTRDDELPFFAEKRAHFKKNKVQIMVSDSNVIKTTNDKYAFCRFLNKNNIPAPLTIPTSDYRKGSFKYPLILKPRYGSGGRGITKIDNEEGLRFFAEKRPDSILQEFIEGKEYTVDVFADFEGNIISVTPRERIEIVSGESYKGKTIKNSKITEYAKALTEKIGAIGHITIQCTQNSKGLWFFEMNPRFGGGANLGIKSGANTPLFLVSLIMGKKLRPQIGDYRSGLTMLRYTEDFFV